jgi:putative transposase
MVTAEPTPLAFALCDRQRSILEMAVRQRSCPQAVALRARIVLATGRGLGPSEVAAELGCSREVARRWRDRFAAAIAAWGEAPAEWDEPTLTDKVLDVLEDQERAGAPATFTPEQLCAIVALACEVRPDECDRPVSHWTSRELADEAVRRRIVPSISPRHVGRFLKARRSARTRSGTG